MKLKFMLQSIMIVLWIFISLNSSAAVVYDEEDDGDADLTTSVGTLGVGDYEFKGSSNVGYNSSGFFEDEDTFSFTLLPTAIIDSFGVIFGNVNIPGNMSIYQLFGGADTENSDGDEYSTYSTNDYGDDFSNYGDPLDSAGAEGIISLYNGWSCGGSCLLAFDYEISLTTVKAPDPVPEPSILALMSLGLLGFGVFRRKV